MFDSDPKTLFTYVARHLNRFGLAYLHIIEPRVRGNVVVAQGQARLLRSIFAASSQAASSQQVA